MRAADRVDDLADRVMVQLDVLGPAFRDEAPAVGDVLGLDVDADHPLRAGRERAADGAVPQPNSKTVAPASGNVWSTQGTR